jgi:hypothetical protein
LDRHEKVHSGRIKVLGLIFPPSYHNPRLSQLQLSENGKGEQRQSSRWLDPILAASLGRAILVGEREAFERMELWLDRRQESVTRNIVERISSMIFD